MSNDAHNRSFVRRGNHFFFIDGPGWVLIDGPWFQYLEKYDCRDIQIPRWEPEFYDLFACDSPVYKKLEFIEWERIRWHPGYLIHPDAISCSWLSRKWHELLYKRTKYGYRLKSNGRIPAYFNSIEFVEDEWWGPELIRLGY